MVAALTQELEMSQIAEIEQRKTIQDCGLKSSE